MPETNWDDFTPEESPAINWSDYVVEQPSPNASLITGDAAEQLRRAGIQRSGPLSAIAGGPPLQLPENALQTSLGEIGQQFGESLTRPAIPLPRANARSPLFQAAMTAAGGGIPPTEDSASTAAALINTGEGFAEFGESPLGVASLLTGGGALGPAAARLTGLAFAGQMASQVPESAKEAGRLSVEGTPQEQKEAYLGLGQNIVLPGLLGAGALKKGEPNAIQERVPETLPLAETPGDRGAVGQGIPAPEKPAEAQAPKPAEAPVQAEIAPEEKAEFDALPKLQAGERVVRIVPADGSKPYLASFADKVWDWGGKKMANVGKNVKGKWSHGMLREGDQIVELGEAGKQPTEETTLTPSILTPDGRLEGKSHPEIRTDASKKGIDAMTGSPGVVEGFVLRKGKGDKGTFLSRPEAMAEFKKLRPEAKTSHPIALTSEDLADQKMLGHLNEPKVADIPVKDIRPQVATIGGGKEVGEKGQVHNDIIAEKGLKAEDVDRREFVGPNGETISREQLAQHPEIKTEVQPGKAHASDLAKAQQITPDKGVPYTEDRGDQHDINPLAVRGPENQKYHPAVQLPDGKIHTGGREEGHYEIRKRAGLGGEGINGYLGKDGKFYRGVLDVLKNETKPPKSTETPTAAPETPQSAKLGTFGPVQVAVEAMAKQAAPAVGKAVEAVKEIGKQEGRAGKMTDERRAVLNWSAKEQRSFQEMAEFQSRIQKTVRDPVRREAITNWIQADGDTALLRRRAAASADPNLARGYMAAAKLTPEEIAIANEVKSKYADLLQRGQANDVVGDGLDNYVTQIWDLGKGPSVGGTRTLRDQFKFNRARTFNNFFEGEQAGFVPKTKDISKLLPVYGHEMNHVIASRELVQELSHGTASDGRPLLSARGSGVPVSGEEGQATLVNPNVAKDVDTRDYTVMKNQPALRAWRWVQKDAAGNPIFLKADLAVHPELYDRLNAALGKSAIREWYQNKTGKLSDIPKWAVQGLDAANSVTKQTMLGLVSPFHQVQEGTHAIGHRVNPFFNIPKVDLPRDPAQMDAAKHGLMLQPDRASADQFMEGFKTSGLVSKIPGIGPLADWYSNYLFHQYIPGLKYKTYSAILERNNKVYAKDVAAGKIAPEEVKALSAQQSNAAFGHLNYADLGRNPTIRHIMQLGLLAPDFLEARGRFAGQALKGATGAKVGREQVLALATLAIAQAATAYTSAKVTGGTWDKKRPFEFVQGNRRYSMRSVPEDVSGLINDTRKFVYSRLSPIIAKGAIQLTTGRDYLGRKVTAGETGKELLQQPIPISVKGFLGVGNNPLKGWEQLAGAVGLRISRYSPEAEIGQLADKWRKQAGPKQEAEAERRAKETLPPSDYAPLRDALQKEDYGAAHSAYQKLLETKPPQQIWKTMRPFTVANGVRKEHPMAGLSAKEERDFVKSLSAEDRKVFNQAKAERSLIWNRFQGLAGSEFKAKQEPASAPY